MGIIKTLGAKGFFWGIGVAALSYILYPKAKETVKPVLVKSVKGAYDIVGKTAEMYDKGREKVGEMFKDSYKEAVDIEHDEFKNQIETLKNEKENAIKEVNELKNKLAILEKEIGSLKNKD